MLGLAIAFALLGVGFAAGYATRGAISRRRRAIYLAYAPYSEPSRRSPPAKEPVHDSVFRLPTSPRLQDGAIPPLPLF